MMRHLGYRIVHYGNGDSFDPHLCEHVSIMDRPELESYVGKYEPAGKGFIGTHARVDSPLYHQWNQRVRKELDLRVQPLDIVCFPFGHAHEWAARNSKGVQGAYLVETGVGYTGKFCDFKVFESYAWLHWHHGHYQYDGSDYEWVIPNYFDVSEWKLNERKGQYVLFFGRICDQKGMRIVVEMAKQPKDLRFVICGQGDPSPYLRESSNLEYFSPVLGEERSRVLGDAIAVLCPSRYIEPFCGVAVEAMLCGRPVLASHFGAFSEILPSHLLPWKLHLLRDWSSALRECEQFTENHFQGLREWAVSRYSTEVIGRRYQRVFDQISGLAKGGWYGGQETTVSDSDP